MYEPGSRTNRGKYSGHTFDSMFCLFGGFFLLFLEIASLLTGARTCACLCVSHHMDVSIHAAGPVLKCQTFNLLSLT